MKKTIMLTCLLSIGILAGCSNTNKVEIGDSVTIIYTGTFSNGAIFEAKETTITAGSQQIIAGLDEAIVGMKKDKSKKLTISPDKGYGKEYTQNNIQRVSKLIFDKLTIKTEQGETVKLGDIEGIIKGTEKDKNGNDIVLFDINPLQTRQDMSYEITIKDIQKAQQTNSGYSL